LEATKESIWLRQLFKELGFWQKQATPIHCDNQGSIKLTKNPLLHSRTKHFDVSFHFRKKQADVGTISVKFVATNQQVADILTKSLDRIKFASYINLLGLVTQY
jgi:hypothetical protein